MGHVQIEVQVLCGDFSWNHYYQRRDFAADTVSPCKVRDRCRYSVCPSICLWTQSLDMDFLTPLIYNVLIRYQWCRRLEIRSSAGGISSLFWWLLFFPLPPPLSRLPCSAPAFCSTYRLSVSGLHSGKEVESSWEVGGFGRVCARQHLSPLLMFEFPLLRRTCRKTAIKKYWT